MNRRCLIFGLALLAVLVFLPRGGAVGDEETPQPASTITFQITFGDEPLGKDLHQLALWLETPEGKYLDTVYVTRKIAQEGLGNGYTKIFGITIREAPEALPVWAHARNVREGKSVYPSKKKPLPDAITSATPEKRQFDRSFELSEKLMKKLNPKAVVCAAEINVSRDGVPSMVFKGALDLTGTQAATLQFVGTGHSKGSNGTITPDKDKEYKPHDYVAKAAATPAE